MKLGKLFMFIFMFLFLWSLSVRAQYFEFSWNSLNSPYSWFQEWCDETYDIFFDTQGTSAITTAQALVLLDDSSINYSQSTDSTVLQNNLFDLYTSSSAWMVSWVSWFPTWDTQFTKVFLAWQNPDDDAVSWYNKFGSLKFVPKYNTTSANFIFVYWWGNETVLNTQVWDVINSSAQSSRLTWAISIEKKPCYYDDRDPSISVISPTWEYVYSDTWLDINLFDNWNDWDVPFVRTGWTVDVGDWTWDYNGNTWGVTNQIGINISSLTVDVTGNGNSVHLDDSDFVVTPDTLMTWQYLPKNYNVKKTSLFDFGVEKPITIDVYIEDRNWNSYTNPAYTFNNPEKPYINNESPEDWSIYVNLESNISFHILDDWAWVDSGSISVTLSGMNEAASWYTETTYLANNPLMNIVKINWEEWLGNSWWYSVDLNPIDFPTNALIQVTVSGADLNWYGWDDLIGWVWTFTTRPDCEEIGCCDGVKLQTWAWAPQNPYTKPQLFISWGINPNYNRNVWDYTWYINCDNLTWALSLYSGDQVTNEFLSYEELNELYFSGQNVKAILTWTNWNTIILYRFGDYTIKVYPQNRGTFTVANNNGFNNKWRLFFYAQWNRTTPVYSWYVDTEYNGTWIFIEDIESWIYDVVYKWRQQLSSYISGLYIEAGEPVELDFTSWSDLYWTVTWLVFNGWSWYQIAWDLVNPVWEQDNMINVADLSILFWDVCWYLSTYVEKCDINNDWAVDSSDGPAIIQNMFELDVAYWFDWNTWLFDGLWLANY